VADRLLDEIHGSGLHRLNRHRNSRRPVVRGSRGLLLGRLRIKASQCTHRPRPDAAASSSAGENRLAPLGRQPRPMELNSDRCACGRDAHGSDAHADRSALAKNRRNGPCASGRSIRAGSAGHFHGIAPAGPLPYFRLATMQHSLLQGRGPIQDRMRQIVRWTGTASGLRDLVRARSARPTREPL